ncbi:glycine betaine ABC transporter substrate-binding protein [Wukongibacter baidiensis]|uniref:glycine betaine ABC transporter substrate-binding protein n=1 Tax=Wukongibacter baidiensis TaxID=1723361 RepID=UPI003D7FBFBF
MLKKVLAVLCIVSLIFSLAACGKPAEEKKIVVGGKEYTEQDILVNIIAEVIENKTDIKVERKSFLGGTQICAQALESGDLDIYPEYTGTALMSVLKEDRMNDPEAVYEKVKKRYEEEKNIIWLKPFGFNNTYALAMKESKAKELGIETYSDLVKHAPNLVFAGTQEYLERADGYKGLKETYGMEFKSARSMDPGLTYTAVKDGKVDVNSAFATDGRIPAFNLKVLKDDKNFFPPYYAAPIIRKDTLEKYPELEEVLNSLAGKIDDSTMASLNSKVDIDKKDAKLVAKEWLKSEGFID